MTTAAPKTRTQLPRPETALTPRGLKARQRLLKAGEAVIERVGYRDMKVGDVTQEAEVASGLFYRYFTDLKSFAICILETFLRRFDDFRIADDADWNERIFAYSLLLVDSYAQNPGLMASMLMVSDEEPEFRKLHQASTKRQLTALAKLLPVAFPKAKLSVNESLLIITSLGGVMETMLREYYIVRNPDLRRIKLAREEMAAYLTTLFYRGLFLENPPLTPGNLTSKFGFISMTHHESPFTRKGRTE